MRLRPRFFVLATAAALLLPAGCGHHPSQTNAPAGNILRVALTDRPTTFDPAMVEDGTTIDMLQQVFEGLVQWTPKNTLAPALAEKWDISNGGRTFTFHLRPNVKFQDGSPFTAQDVYYSMRRALDPKLKSTVALAYLGDIVGAKEENSGKTTELAGVKVVDPQTVAITITRPKPYWIYTLTYPTAFVVSKAEADKANGPITEAEIKGAGTGAFSFARYDTDSKVVLTANPNYWGGPPKVARIERPIIKDSGTRHDEYLSGQLDFVDEPQGSVEGDLKDPALKDQVQYWARASTFYIGLNQSLYAPFKDVRVRQALAYATDKQRIRHAVFGDRVDVAEDILPEGIPGFDPKFKGLPYDPAKAKSLLAAAGYPGGKGLPPLPISFRAAKPEQTKTVDLLRDMWGQNLRVTVQSNPVEWGTLLNQEHDNALPCYQIRWAADYLDPQDYYSILLRTGGGENHTTYSNPRFDALCDRADVEQNPARRNALFRQAASIAAQEVPLIPIFYQKDIELVKPYVHNLEDGLMGHLPYKNLTLAK